MNNLVNIQACTFEFSARAWARVLVSGLRIEGLGFRISLLPDSRKLAEKRRDNSSIAGYGSSGFRVLGR